MSKLKLMVSGNGKVMDAKEKNHSDIIHTYCIISAIWLYHDSDLPLTGNKFWVVKMQCHVTVFYSLDILCPLSLYRSEL